MLDFDSAIRNLNFTKKDVTNITHIYSAVKDSFDSIAGEVLKSFCNDPRVQTIMRKGNVSEEKARKVWIKGLNYIFNIKIDKNFLNGIKEIGRIHVVNEVEEDLVIEAMTLFIIKIIQIVVNMENTTVEEVTSLIKGFNLVLVLMISSYRDEMNDRQNAVLKFMGISNELLKRQIEIGKKSLKED